MDINEKKLKSLIGATIKRIEHYDDGSLHEGYYLIFNNGLILTARDGEYGENALEFVNEEEYNKEKNKKEIK